MDCARSASALYTVLVVLILTIFLLSFFLFCQMHSNLQKTTTYKCLEIYKLIIFSSVLEQENSNKIFNSTNILALKRTETLLD